MVQDGWLLTAPVCRWCGPVRSAISSPSGDRWAEIVAGGDWMVSVGQHARVVPVGGGESVGVDAPQSQRLVNEVGIDGLLLAVASSWILLRRDRTSGGTIFDGHGVRRGGSSEACVRPGRVARRRCLRERPDRGAQTA